MYRGCIAEPRRRTNEELDVATNEEQKALHPSGCFTSLRPSRQSGIRASRGQAPAPRPLTIAMTLLVSSVPGASSHLSRVTLGRVAQRNVTSNDNAVALDASSSGRLCQGAACLASSASCQVFGSRELASWKSSSRASRKQARRVHTVRIRCEQTTDGGNRRSLETWIGRLAMLSFFGTICVEVSTGKGVLASVGLPPLVPTPVLGVVALAGTVLAFGVFRSSDRD